MDRSVKNEWARSSSLAGLFSRMVLLVSFALLPSCSPEHPPFPDEDREKVLEVIQQYADAWVRMDSSAILSLFTDDAVITPSGLSPRRGKDALIHFWFSDTSVTTTVHSYTIEVLDSGGSGGLAWTFERGDLSYTMSRAGYSLTRDATSYATTIYQKGRLGKWKIERRLWTDMRLEKEPD